MPPLPNYCEDGQELLTEIPTLVGDNWNSQAVLTTTVPGDSFQVRFTMARETTDPPFPGNYRATVGDYATPYFQIPESISGTLPYTITVPLYESVDLPFTAYFVRSSGASANLLSVCIIPYTRRECAQGIETVITPTVLTMGGGPWRSEMLDLSEWREYGATVTLLDSERFFGGAKLYYPVGSAGAMGYAGYQFDYESAEIVTFTLPTTVDTGRGIRAGGNAQVELRNGAMNPFTVYSVCVFEVVTREAPAVCGETLINHDFDSDPAVDWSPTHVIWDEVSAVRLGDLSNIGSLSQYIQTEGGLYGFSVSGDWTFLVRARRHTSSAYLEIVVSSNDFTSAPILLTDELENDYVTFVRTFTLPEQSFSFAGTPVLLEITGQNVVIDWICFQRSAALGGGGGTPIAINCGEFPGFEDHPDMSITEIGNWILWLARKFFDILEFIVCWLIKFLAAIYNLLLDIYRFIMGFVPDSPETWTPASYLDWWKQLFENIGLWLGESLLNILFSGQTVTEWLYSLWVAVTDWLVGQIAFLLDLTEEEMQALLDFLQRDIFMFVAVLQEEVRLEMQSFRVLVTTFGEVVAVLVIGMRAALSDSTEANFGENLGGMGAFLWRGVEFVNEMIEGTPLEALNILSIGVLGVGLVSWSLARVKVMVARFLTALGGGVLLGASYMAINNDEE